MDLIEATDADFTLLMAGEAPRNLNLPDGAFESPETLQMLRGLANQIRPVFTPASWLIVETREIVGLCSLVKQPSDFGIDVGYGVAAHRRRRGHAVDAVRELIDWARLDARVQTVRAETTVDNRPSQRVLERNGFVRAGERLDEEDGHLVCWRIDVET